MTQHQEQPPASAPAAAPTKKRPIWLVVLAGGLLVAGAAAAAITASAGDDQAHRPAKPTTFAVTGSVTVEAGEGESAIGGSCSTDGGYSDIRTGAQVTVKDASGKVIGVGALRAGTTSEARELPSFNEGTGQIEDALQATKCSFGFAVEGVPEGESFYSVEVSRRGELRYERPALASGLKLTLGD